MNPETGGKQHLGYDSTMNTHELITVDPEILGGAPVFKGTRVPIKTRFEYLENNYSLDEFVECFPSVTREMACRLWSDHKMPWRRSGPASFSASISNDGILAISPVLAVSPRWAYPAKLAAKSSRIFSQCRSEAGWS
jgi:uncharacterized protein (DUF433 family)